MHLRRALLLFALVLGLTALATAIAPAPKRDDEPATADPGSSATSAPEASVTFRAPVAKRRPPTRRVAPGSHLTVVVAARRPGQVEIPRLGLTATATASAPARFDLLAPDAGRSAVVFTPTAGRRAAVGMLVSRRGGS